jgi:hypothetical protein
VLDVSVLDIVLLVLLVSVLIAVSVTVVLFVFSDCLQAPKTNSDATATQNASFFIGSPPVRSADGAATAGPRYR